LPRAHRFNPELPWSRPGISGGFNPQVLRLIIVFEGSSPAVAQKNSMPMIVGKFNQ
jgi:hypothetical protein